MTKRTQIDFTRPHETVSIRIYMSFTTILGVVQFFEPAAYLRVGNPDFVIIRSNLRVCAVMSALHICSSRSILTTCHVLEF